MSTQQRVALIVLDGWGYRESKEHNAIENARKPFFDSLWNTYPHNLLLASGEAVGLPQGVMGNSEVGHNTMGAGRIVESDIVRINTAIADGTFAQRPALKKLFEHVKKNNSMLHVVGLLSSGGVHSHEDHLYAFLQIAKDAGITNIAIHAFTDGMDTGPTEAVTHIKKLEAFLKKLGVGKIATVSGRYYAMDRDNNWERLQKVEDAIFKCEGNVCHVEEPSALLESLLQSLYTQKIDDTHIEPIVCLDLEGKGCTITDNDGVFFFNFRPDRARMLSQKVAARAQQSNIQFVTMTEYDKKIPCDVVFPPISINNTLGELISNHGLTQIRIAESEKYAHATYFLNAGREEPFIGQHNVLVPSNKDKGTCDKDPQMKAYDIAQEGITAAKQKIDFIFINFANADMVGHTGNEEATISAIETIDKALANLIPVMIEEGIIVLITSDHGNAEIKRTPSGEPSVTHTTNPVPIIITTHAHEVAPGGLQDIAPTILSLLNIPQQKEMTGTSLLR